MTMHMRIVAVAGLTLMIGLPAAGVSFAETIRIGGTGAVTEMLRQIGPAFTAETGITLEVIPSLGSGGGNAAAADGVLDLSVSGRELNEKERQKGLTIAATFRTPFGLVTSRPGPDALKSSDLAGIYKADKATWPDGKPIRIILRPTNESDTSLLGSLFPGMAEAIEQARTRPDLTVAATDQDNAKAAVETEGSLVGATLTQIMTEKRDLRFVAIDGVEPTMASFESGAYQYGKTLYLVTLRTLTPEAASFLAFAATEEGSELLRKAGIVAGAK